MSTLKVNAISDAAGANGNAITLATDGSCTVKATNNLSNRRLNINGAFNVAQRGTTANTSGYKTVDRFNIGSTGMDEVPTQAQVALTSSDTGPWAKGFRYALQVTNGNQTSGAGAGDNIYIYHYIEAQDIASSGWDYTNASSKLTLSFWVKSSVAQNFYGFVKTMDGTAQLLSFETTALSANTWKKVTLSIPGHANLQFDTNAEAGFQIAFSPFFGTDFTTSGKTLNAWAAYSGSDRMPDNTSTWFTTNDATFALTGVQLEVGHATDFEHRSYGDELAKCKRYYEKRQTGAEIMFTVYAANSVGYIHWPFQVTKRAAGNIAHSGWDASAFGTNVSVAAGPDGARFSWSSGNHGYVGASTVLEADSEL